MSLPKAEILHADLDAFYASVEQRDDPRLRARPVIVGMGVVLAASYEAKACGVRTAMGGAQARRACPEAIVVAPRMSAYSEASKAVFEIFRQTSPLVEGLSIDEAFLDVRGMERIAGSPTEIAVRLRHEVRERVGLAITVGVARTKFLAKVASGVAKPDGVGYPHFVPAMQPACLTRAFTWGIVARAKPRRAGRKLRLIAAVESLGGTRDRLTPTAHVSLRPQDCAGRFSLGCQRTDPGRGVRDQHVSCLVRRRLLGQAGLEGHGLEDPTGAPMQDAPCTNCGNPLAPGVRFCTSCGATVPPPLGNDPPPVAGDQRPGGDDRPPAGEAPTHRGSSRGARRALILAVCALLSGASGVAAVYLVAGGSDPPRVVLEPVTLASADAFVANLDADPRAGRMAAAQARNPARRYNVIEDPRSARHESALSGQVARGSAPGLYGGSRDTRTCKVGRLIEFLTARRNAGKAAAFAGVLGIARGRISEYIRTLTAARLSFDTRVTNHNFVDGKATPSQSLLQAGTAVLVDRSGVPRVKCNCGNPLLEPAELEKDESGDKALDVARLADNAGDAWQGLDPKDAVTVRPARDRSDEITLVDLETPDGLLERPVGSDGASERDTGTGDVKVTLEWQSDADLDLHVVEPDATEISYTNKGPTSTGGQLDVDANVGCDENGSLENVFWPLGDAPPGEYEVKVIGFTVDECGGGGDFKLTIDVAGKDPQIYEGFVGEDEEETYSFSSGR